MLALRSSAAHAAVHSSLHRGGNDLTATARQQAAPAACRQQRRRQAAERARPQQPLQLRWWQPPSARGPAAAAAGPSGERNPQNVDQPLVLPSPALSPEQAVAAQLDALAANDEPWGNHGVQTLYEFAHDVGGLDPSMFFGYPKDLYHFDHYMGLFLTKLGPLVNHGGYSLVGGARQAGGDPDTLVVTAEVTPAGAPGPQRYEFHLRQKLVGPRKGAWTTWMLVAAEEAS